MNKYLLTLFAVPMLLLWSGVTAADCWELTDKEGRKFQVNDIWHVKSRLGGGGVLIGTLDGEDASIAVSEINTVTLVPVKAGLMSFMGNHAMQGIISFTSGSKAKFASDLNLMFLKDAEKSSMPLTDLRSITRCDAEMTAMMTDTGQETLQASTHAGQPVASDVDSVYLSNGDILLGAITIDDIRWQAPYASLTFKSEQVKAITLQRDGAVDGLLELRSGDRISGTLKNTSVEMTLKYGQRVPLATEKIKSIHFRE